MADEKSIETILGQNMKELRKELGLTQEELAEKAGVTVKYVSHLERALSFPSAETLNRISIALGVPVFRLFFPVDDTESIIPRDVLRRELHRLIDELM